MSRTRQLEKILLRVHTFAKPSFELEQYPTPGGLASICVATADAVLASLKGCESGKVCELQLPVDPEGYGGEDTIGGFEGSSVCDLGCGGGVLGIATAALGASFVMFIDIDSDALSLSRTNCIAMKLLSSCPEKIACKSLVASGNLNDGSLHGISPTVGGSELIGSSQDNASDSDNAISKSDSDSDSDESNSSDDALWRRCAVEFLQVDVLDWSPLERGCLFDTVICNPPFGTKAQVGADLQFVERGLSIARYAVFSLHKTATRKYIMKWAEQRGARAEILAQLRWPLRSTMTFHQRRTVTIEVDFICFLPERMQQVKVLRHRGPRAEASLPPQQVSTPTMRTSSSSRSRGSLRGSRGKRGR